MQHKDYWTERFDQLTDAQLNKGAEYYHNLEEQYRKAIQSVEKDLAKWYARYATENGISLTEAKRLLSGRDLEEFRMDVKEYIKKGETLNYSSQWAKQLEAASVKVHVSRLEALKIQMQQQAEAMYATEADALDSLARNIYTDGYYRTAYEIQKGIGVGFDLMQLDTNKIDKLIAKPWAADGKNFSQRIWNNRAQLVSELENRLTQSIIRGQSPKKVIAEIAERFNVNKSKAGRLVMTESAFFASASQRDAFNDLDVERYEVLATLDSRTSPICRAMDGKVLPMSEYKPGVTAPPFHVYCRSTTVPYFDDEFTADEQRAARGKDGEYYTVPASMKYEEWKKTFVDGGSKENLAILDIDKNEVAAKLKNIGFTDEQASEISNAIGDLPANSREKEIWAETMQEAPFEITDGEDDEAYFSTRTGKIRFNRENNESRTAFHEAAHWKDVNAVKKKAFDGADWGWEINDASDWVQHVVDQKNGSAPRLADLASFAKKLGMEVEGDGNYWLWFKEPEKVFEAFNEWIKKEIKPKYGVSAFDDKGFSSVADILSGLTNDEIRSSLIWGGHVQEYWMSNAKLFYKEAWADFCTLKATNNKPMLGLLEELTPNLYKALEDTYNEVFGVGEKATKKPSLTRLAKAADTEIQLRDIKQRYKKMLLNQEPPTDDFIKYLATKQGKVYNVGKKGADRFYAEDGRAIYPPNNGGIGKPEPFTLKAKKRIRVDRFGDNSGSYVSPLDTPPSQRAMSKHTNADEYHVFEVIKDIEVEKSVVAPWFGEVGKGIQYKLPGKIHELLNTHLKEIDKKEVGKNEN